MAREKQEPVVPLEERFADIEASMTCEPALPVHEAWEIANTWNEELTHRCFTTIGLRMDASAPMRVTESLEWVTIESVPRNCEDHETAGRHGGFLRAVCSTWVMLASCPGYGGDENPVFWKYVFAAWRSGYDRGFSDSDYFFTRHSFPRFRLGRLVDHSNRGDVPAMCRAFFGVDPVTPDVAYQRIQSQFQELQERLMPLVDKKRSQRPVEVSLELSTDGLGSTVSAVSSHNNQATANNDGIRFIQHEVNLNGIIRSYPPSHALLIGLLSAQSVEIPRMDFIEKYEDQKAYYDLINKSCSVHNCSTARVRSIEISRDHVSNQEIAALFSALPHARSLRTVHYRGQIRDLDRNRLGEHMKREWVWIGYALFHPDTATSTWCELYLKSLTISDEILEVLSAMSQGNNLLAILNGTPTENTAYFSATLVAGSSLVRNPSFSAVSIMQFDKVKTVDAVVTSTDLSSLGEFVPLVVPGLGLVYTQRVNVLQLTERAPSPVCLKSLHFHSYGAHDPRKGLVYGLLKLIGSKLGHLTFLDLKDKFSVRDLRQLLGLTPVLQSLVTDAVCVPWSVDDDDEVVPALPTLQELEISIPRSATLNAPSELAFRTYFRDLRALRVKILETKFPDPNRHNEMVLPRSLNGLLTILRGLPEFKYLHWHHFYHSSRIEDQIKQYAPSRQCTWKKVKLGFSPRDREARMIEQRGPARRRAFLSAIRESPSVSALGQFDRNVVSMILGFATVYRHRNITVQRRDLDS